MFTYYPAAGKNCSPTHDMMQEFRLECRSLSAANCEGVGIWAACEDCEFPATPPVSYKKKGM